MNRVTAFTFFVFLRVEFYCHCERNEVRRGDPILI